MTDLAQGHYRNPAGKAASSGVVLEMGGNQVNAANPLPSTEITLHAGERGVGTSNDYSVAVQECNLTSVSGTSEVLISSAPALLLAIIQEDAATAGNVTLRNAAATGSGLTGPIYKVAAGNTSAHLDFHGAKFTTGLTVQLTGGSFSILWRPV